MFDVEICRIAATTHGRYLIDMVSDGSRVLLGFHGYGESAEMHLSELRSVDAPGWTRVAIQALHPFYSRRMDDVVASWMTRQDREMAIDENLHYVRAVVAELRHRWPIEQIVVTGFSQGATMAYRVAADPVIAAAAVAVLGGDVPPDVISTKHAILPPVLLGRGSGDEWYTGEKLKQDLSFLRTKTSVTLCEFDGGHVWSDEYRVAMRQFLMAL